MKYLSSEWSKTLIISTGYGPTNASTLRKGNWQTRVCNVGILGFVTLGWFWPSVDILIGWAYLPHLGEFKDTWTLDFGRVLCREIEVRVSNAENQNQKVLDPKTKEGSLGTFTWASGFLRVDLNLLLLGSFDQTLAFKIGGVWKFRVSSANPKTER